MKSVENKGLKSSPVRFHPDIVQTLVCKIMVWEPVDKSKFENPPKQCLVLNECVEIKITDTYKKLINTATVKIPKGTVIKKDLRERGGKEEAVYVERMSDGALTERRSYETAATPSHFHTGQRIRIYLGYYHEDKVYSGRRERDKAIERSFRIDPDFDGYITKCSATTPIEIQCEDLASCLKRKTCPAMPPREHVKLYNLFKSKAEGGLDLLAGTGLKLDPGVKDWDYDLGRISIPEGWTVADLLSKWGQAYIYSYVRMQDGVPYLVIGRPYFAGNVKGSLFNWNQSARGQMIQFDYDVAQDNLTMMNVDPLFLAVEAQCPMPNNKFYKITVTLNPQWNSEDPDSPQYRLINESNLNKKTMQFMGIEQGKNNQKVDLSRYHVVPYISSVIGLGKEKLIEEAKAYFASYNKNGVEGSVTVFGDYHIKAGSKVELYDDMNPEKNGWYFVDEVTTSFGVNGFRQTLHLPYCTAKAKRE